MCTSHVGEVVCEPPNNRLHKFVGSLAWNDDKYSLDNDRLVLRVSLTCYLHMILCIIGKLSFGTVYVHSCDLRTTFIITLQTPLCESPQPTEI